MNRRACRQGVNEREGLRKMTAIIKVMYTKDITFFMEPVRLLSIIGLLLITWGVLEKKELRQDWMFVSGGILLFFYSYWLGDIVFMTLQVIFTLASLYEIYTLKKK